MKGWLLSVPLLIVPALWAQVPVAEADRSETISGTTVWLPPEPVGVSAVGVCPDCGGKGEVGYAKASRFRGELEEAPPIRVRCKRCSGSGRARRNLTPDERIDAQRAIRQAYVRRQLAAGHVPIGDAYIERNAADALEPAAYAALAHRFPKSCETCYGLKVSSCKSCDGVGYTIEEEAQREEKIRHTKIGSAIRRNRPGGATEDADATIRRKRVACARCSGTGAVPCRKCKGSGVTALCRRCQGVGTDLDKRRKDESGNPLLKRCASCKGTGRR